jgi:hypothetical protein
MSNGAVLACFDPQWPNLNLFTLELTTRSRHIRIGTLSNPAA